MTQRFIDIGTGYDTRDGEEVRDAFEAANANFSELYRFLPLIDALTETVAGLPAPDAIKAQIALAIAQALAQLPSPQAIQDQIRVAIQSVIEGVPSAASIQAQIDAAVAATDISNFYTKAQADARFSGGTMPMRAVAGAGRAYDVTDVYTELRRSNGGAPMSDTLPPASTDPLADGASLRVHNIDLAGGVVAILPGTGTTLATGGATVASISIEPGRTVTFAYDKPGTVWRPVANSLSSLLSGNALKEIAARGAEAQAAARANIGAAGNDDPVAQQALVSALLFNAQNFV